MKYKKVTVRLTPMDETASALTQAEMGERGFECFVDTEEGFEGYIQETDWSESTMAGIDTGVEDVGMEWEATDAPDEDWNATWEQEGFTPIEIDGRMRIRSTEHESDPKMEMEIVISPKLAFGTGHHETTRMIARWIMNNEMKGKRVMDMGCGTGILGIAAKKRGAESVDAVDIDEWSVRNTEENAALNGVGITAWEGGAETIEGKSEEYDIFIANINRNILMEGMSQYAKSLKRGGRMVLSGFLKDDIAPLEKRCSAEGLKKTGGDGEGEWRMMELTKE